MNLKTVCCCVVTLNISLWNNHLARRRWEREFSLIYQLFNMLTFTFYWHAAGNNALYLLFNKSKKVHKILEFSWSSNGIMQKCYYRKISMYMSLIFHAKFAFLIFLVSHYVWVKWYNHLIHFICRVVSGFQSLIYNLTYFIWIIYHIFYCWTSYSNN